MPVVYMGGALFCCAGGAFLHQQERRRRMDVQEALEREKKTHDAQEAMFARRASLYTSYHISDGGESRRPLRRHEDDDHRLGFQTQS